MASLNYKVSYIDSMALKEFSNQKQSAYGVTDRIETIHGKTDLHLFFFREVRHAQQPPVFTFSLLCV